MVVNLTVYWLYWFPSAFWQGCIISFTGVRPRGVFRLLSWRVRPLWQPRECVISHISTTTACGNWIAQSFCECSGIYCRLQYVHWQVQPHSWLITETLHAGLVHHKHFGTTQDLSFYGPIAFSLRCSRLPDCSVYCHLFPQLEPGECWNDSTL